ncbi:MAG: hypothetical protein HQL53_00995 [Magnetococcales bacterium]|nr:hypothetical protein [Magnetococcales bacterium]
MESGFSLKQPVSVWNRALKTDFTTFFTNLSQAAIQGSFEDWKGAGKSALKALSAIKVEELSCAERGWLLIQRALTDAAFRWGGESLNNILRGISDDDKPSADGLAETLKLAQLEAGELMLDASFFNKPERFPFLKELEAPLKMWLQGVGMGEAPATSMAKRFPSYFVLALHRQWGDRPEDYNGLKENLETPFCSAVERDRAWSQYRAWLQKQVNEPLFDQPFGLAQVYQPLRAWYELEVLDEGETPERLPRRVAYLHEVLDKWLRSTDRRDALRMVWGGPGSGKSSFSKTYAANLARSKPDLPVLLVPLHRLHMERDLVAAVGNYVRRERIFTDYNPLDINEGDERLLVIFDGLDELAMLGDGAAYMARKFVDEVQRQLADFNSRELRLQVLITSRTTIGQSNADQVREPGKVLQLLPYWVSKEERKEKWRKEDDPGEFLLEDQRDDWWLSYGQVSGSLYGEMPEALKMSGLDEVTSQPLLCYLVALSYEGKRIQFTEHVDLNRFYRDLVKSVVERMWGN